MIHCGTQSASVALLCGPSHYGMIEQPLKVVLEIDEDLEKVEPSVWNVSFENNNGYSNFTLKRIFSRTSGGDVELHVKPQLQLN